MQCRGSARGDPLTAPRGGFARGLTLQTDDGVLAARLDKDADTVELTQWRSGADVPIRGSATVHEVRSDSEVTQTASSITHRIGSNTIDHPNGRDAITFVGGRGYGAYHVDGWLTPAFGTGARRPTAERQY